MQEVVHPHLFGAVVCQRVRMCASLAQGMFNLSGAAKYLLNWDTTTTLLIGIGCIFVIPAIISSISGILSGIKILSDLNMRLYVIIVAFLICTTNIPYVLNLGIESLGEFINTYFQQSLATGVARGTPFSPIGSTTTLPCGCQPSALPPSLWLYLPGTYHPGGDRGQFLRPGDFLHRMDDLPVRYSHLSGHLHRDEPDSGHV